MEIGRAVETCDIGVAGTEVIVVGMLLSPVLFVEAELIVVIWSAFVLVSMLVLLEIE